MPDDDIKIIDDPNDPLAEAAGDAAGAPPEKIAVSGDPDEVIADLKKQLDAANARAAVEARRANDAAAQVHSAGAEVQDSQLALVTNALETVKQNGEVLKGNYAAALEAGDFAQAAEIQEQIAENVQNRKQLQDGKAQLEAQAKTPKPAPQRTVDPGNAVETMASRLTPKSADWLRAHPDYAINPRLTQRMLAAHNLAVTDDIATDTPEYFAHVERTLGITKPAAQDADEGTAQAAKVVGRRDAAPAAAPSSSAGSSNSRAANTVRLNASEREMAQMMGMSDAEYGKHKLALIKEGKLN